MASKINVDKIARGSGTPEFTIPTADGAADTFLKTDGSGVLSFDTVTTTALTGSTNTWIPTITGADALAGTANFTYDGNTLDIKNGGTASSINLYCETSNLHYTKIKSGPHASATSYTITLPNAPPTVAGQALTATTAGVASWSTVGDNTPAFRAYCNSDQTIGSTSQTLVEMQTVEFDSDSDYDNTAGNYKWTPSVAGRYFIYARVNTNTALTTDSEYVGCSINKNGSGGPGDNNAWTKYGWPSVSTIVEMNGSSDYVQVYTQTNKAGGFQTYASASGSSTSWFGFRLDGVS